MMNLGLMFYYQVSTYSRQFNEDLCNLICGAAHHKNLALDSDTGL